MWEQIGAAAIYGAIGGGVGALIGAILATPFRRTRFAQMATTILTVAFVVIGYNVSEPLLKPYIGDYLPKSAAASEFDEQYDLAFAQLEAFPTFAAILEREPGLKEQLKNDLVAATENTISPGGASLAAYSASYNLIQSRYFYYIARARDEDLIVFLETNVEITRDLLARDPQFCYDMNYNPAALSGVASIEQLRIKVGAELFDRQQKEGATLVRNAYDKIPDYDKAAAAAGLESARGVLFSVLGEENLGLISGQRFAANEEEAALACEATLALLNSALAQENPAIIWRHIFAGLG
ncbi:hypothetical protein MNBD_ALPHA05-893 [hydrothermal vent metagenome]|uniref:Uncharacterized protein n=1 Tax=hydrothermal vent metagenome TaxID=652676 RepID=A0A3B0S6H4_9ZZZZ